MMYKSKFRLVIIIIYILSFGMSNIIYSESKDYRKSLIVYESETVFGENKNSLNYLKDILYVFNKEVNKININDYKKGYINKFDNVFVININSDIDNKDFLDDLSLYSKKIYWIGDKIEDLLSTTSSYSVKYISQNDNITSLGYKDKNINTKLKENFNVVTIDNNKNIIATMSDGFNVYPYILKDKNLYYISKLNIGESYIFEDSLNDFYNKRHFDKEEILIKIENINENTNLENIRDVVDYLYKKEVSFILSVTTSYIDDNKDLDAYKINKEFADMLKYAQNKGGNIVINFEHIKSDNKTVNINENMIADVLRNYISNDIYPLAIEANKNLSDYFSTYIGNYNDQNYIINNSPYIIENSKSLKRFYPKNLGKLNNNDKFSINKIKEEFYKLSMVRGYSGQVAFNIEDKINNLDEIINFFKSENINFLKLDEKKNTINIEDIKIESNNGKFTVDYDKSKVITTNDKFDNFIKSTNNVLIKFISIILILFLLIFIYFKFLNIRKFTRR